jgi:cell division protein FtsB
MAKTAHMDHRLSRTQIVMVCLLVILVIILVDFGGLVLKFHELDLQAAALQKENQVLEAQGRDLQQRLDFVRSDEYVRTVAPDMLLWGDPAAKYLMPIDGKPATTPTVPGGKTP